MAKQATTNKPAAKAAPATAKAAPAAPVVIVQPSGRLPVAVLPTGAVYRVGCAHNKAWWETMCAAMAQGKPAQVPALVAAGVPPAFIGYVVRRGYAKAA